MSPPIRDLPLISALLYGGRPICAECGYVSRRRVRGSSGIGWCRWCFVRLAELGTLAPLRR